MEGYAGVDWASEKHDVLVTDRAQRPQPLFDGGRRSQIIDEQGELTLQKRIVTGREMFTELLGEPDGAHVALEATYGWEWLAELLTEAGFDVHLAHRCAPGRSPPPG